MTLVLSDQVKSLGWRARRVRFLCRLPPLATQVVPEKLGVPLSPTQG